MNVISMVLASLCVWFSAWHSAQSYHCLQHGARIETCALRMCLLCNYMIRYRCSELYSLVSPHPRDRKEANTGIEWTVRGVKAGEVKKPATWAQIHHAGEKLVYVILMSHPIGHQPDPKLHWRLIFLRWLRTNGLRKGCWRKYSIVYDNSHNGTSSQGALEWHIYMCIETEEFNNLSPEGRDHLSRAHNDTDNAKYTYPIEA